jgi:hypothetical protein
LSITASSISSGTGKLPNTVGSPKKINKYNMNTIDENVEEAIKKIDIAHIS